MMDTVYFDPRCHDDERRRRIFEGQIFVYSPRPSTLAFVEFTRGLVEEAFAPLDPRTAQHHMEVQVYADLLTKLKPRFIHHPDAKRHIQAILTDLGCDLTATYFDVPKLRSSTSDGFLTTGIAYAWHPHRDTWYSAPACQINWWLPVYDLSNENTLAFHPRYFREPVANTSAGYNYYLWNQKFRGGHVGQLIKKDDRPLPRPTQAIELDPQVRLVAPPGSVIMFSAQQMHSTVPNTSGETRFSIDFRLVNSDDARARRGAPVVDVECTGTTMRDYLRGVDLSHVPDEIVRMYDDGSGELGGRLFQPTDAS
jgi:hypothetical protein